MARVRSTRTPPCRKRGGVGVVGATTACGPVFTTNAHDVSHHFNYPRHIAHPARTSMPSACTASRIDIAQRIAR